jgi:hypothetical protein
MFGLAWHVVRLSVEGRTPCKNRDKKKAYNQYTSSYPCDDKDPVQMYYTNVLLDYYVFIGFHNEGISAFFFLYFAIIDALSHTLI